MYFIEVTYNAFNNSPVTVEAIAASLVLYIARGLEFRKVGRRAIYH
jgi:hypothetical protein